MPIYEYECKDCGHEWEEIQRITEVPLTHCPTCGAPKAHRLISQTSFILKGSGWYVTDYGRGTSGRGDEKGEKGEKGEKKATDTPTTEKKESTPAKKD